MMNNLAYMGQDGQTVVPKVEELLSKELGTSGPIPSSVEVEGGGVTAGSVLRDLGASVFGGNVVPLFTIHFQLTQPRPVQLACTCCGRAWGVLVDHWLTPQA
jgi:hypothetical protein